MFEGPSKQPEQTTRPRSRLVRVGTIYVVSGWLLIQFADISLEAFETPAWIMQGILIVILAGLPVTLAAIWLIDNSKGAGTRKFASSMTIFVALVLSSSAYYYYSGDFAAPDDLAEGAPAVRASNPVLAILPFANMSASRENEYLADGMTEDVITLLARSPGVEVIARNSTFKYKHQSPDIRDVATDLGADYVVEGSIRSVGDRIRVTVQVIDADSGAHVWAEKYDRPINEIFDVQDDVTLGIAAAVGDAVLKTEFSRLNRSRTENLTAWALTNQAEMEFNVGLVREETLAKARQAVAADPGFALAHAILARELALRALVERS